MKQRAADRVRLDLSAFLTIGNAAEVSVVISDFSSCGFSCRCAEPLAIGSAITLHIPDLGRFRATVVWQLGTKAGAQFEAPLPVATVLSVGLAVAHEQASRHDPDSMMEDEA
jgi:hypothetical protein